jgi:hypothetical protein
MGLLECAYQAKARDLRGVQAAELPAVEPDQASIDSMLPGNRVE